MTLTEVYGPPWLTEAPPMGVPDPGTRQVRIRWAILRVGLGRGEIDVDPNAPRDVVEWRWYPGHIVDRWLASPAGAPWFEVYRP